jgi:hypothetical protein
MKINFLLAATFIFLITIAQPVAARNEPVRTATSAGSAPVVEISGKIEVSAAASSSGTKFSEPVSSGDSDLPGQERPRKAKAQESGNEPKNEKQGVKEVATAKRQEKPEKVSEEKENGVSAARNSAARPQSAARPGRGAASSVVKAAGNATKGVKVVKPVKVGVGLGPIKVGKN